MKYLLLFLSCYTCLGQVGFGHFSDEPYLAGRYPSTAWDGTPEGLGSMYAHWVYTNINISISTDATNWIDLIQGRAMVWSGDLNKPRVSGKGVLSTAATGARDRLHNASFNVGTNYSYFAVFNQIDNNFQSPGVLEPLFADDASGNTRFFGNETSAANPGVYLIDSGLIDPIVLTPNGKSIDAYVTWSNGVYWTWTNGVVCRTAVSAVNTPWSTGLSFFCNGNSVFGPWHGTLSESGFYTNLYFNTTTVSNLHYYVTNVVRMNGISP